MTNANSDWCRKTCYVTFTNYIRNLSFPFHWTFCFFSAIAFWSLIMRFRCDFFIMSIDDFWHIDHATVADFKCIVVKHFVKFWSFEKVLLPIEGILLQRLYLNGFDKGWIKPYYVLLSRFWFCWFASGVFQINIKTRLL